MEGRLATRLCVHSNLRFCETIDQGGILSNIQKKKNRGGSRNPATTSMELYVARSLDLLLKRNKSTKPTIPFGVKKTTFYNKSILLQ